MKNKTEFNQDFEINLNFISTTEFLDYKNDFEKYKKDAIFFLKKSKKIISRKDLSKRFNTNKIDNLLKSSPLVFELSDNIEDKKDKNLLNYIDLTESIIVQPENVLYDLFFAYKLRQISIFDIEPFLEYQLSKNYNEEILTFKKFLINCLRANISKIKSETRETVLEWITEKESESSPRDSKKKGNKRLKRTNNDKKTSLTQGQTVLLIHYLREKKAFYDNSYLSNKEIGQAFELLTGYSSDTIRQDLGKIDESKSNDNVKTVLKFLTDLTKTIESDLPAKKNK